ncbi:hypothetical protein VF21_02715 [Pseudogymnoascus sp. 05NY08]|nr:hypothetical protein VF21_02715 [Pseudogymnoascus sp. 05NY08]
MLVAYNAIYFANSFTDMDNTTPIPVPDGDPQMSADSSRTYAFVYEHPRPKELLPSGRIPRVNPAKTIVEAVVVGDLAQVSSLVADASYSPDAYLERALIAAVKEDQLEIGRYLLDHGAKMEKPVLHIMPGRYASIENSLPFFKLFVERGWDINYIQHGRTALFDVIDDHEFVTWLLAHGADPNLGRVGNGIISDGHILDMAALCSTVDIFNELIAHGARLKDSLALHHAAARAPGPLDHNVTQLMARLLELGVDINEPDDKGEPKNGSIGAPIYWAIRMSQIANLKLLVENGADLTVEAPYIGGTPLEKARTGRKRKITEYLESLPSRNDIDHKNLR